MGDEVQGGPPESKSFWARFSNQETGPQRVVVGLAGTVTAVATAIGGVYAVTTVVGGDESSTSAESTLPSTSASEPPSSGSTDSVSSPSGVPTSTPTSDVTVRPGQTLIEQGSPEADAFVRAFVDADGGRVDLDVVLLAERKDRNPQWYMRLWYNCDALPPGEPPGEDLCDAVMLVFDDSDPSPTDYDRPRRIELRGTWADNRPMGLGYGASGMEFYLTQASF
jgi:hypothetical protein